MKKILFVTLLSALWYCLPLFADGVDVTDKIVNPDFSNQLNGWKIECYSENLVDGNWIYYTEVNETDVNREGNWYINGGVCYFESRTFLGRENCISQTITGLKNGTYVFSAVAVMVRKDFDFMDPLDYLNCQGVYFFANEASELIQGYGTSRFATLPWSHSRMYRVPVVVTDGTLTIGQRYEEGNNADGCYIDHLRLFYFGDTTPEQAEAEMCKIDIDNSCYVADSLAASPMSKENFEDIKHACSMKEGATTTEELAAVNDSIRAAIGHARPSIRAFEPLVKLVSTAEEVLAGKWSEMVTTQLKELSVALDQVKADLAGHTISADAYAGYYQDFEETINRVRIDALWDLLDQLYTFIDFPQGISEDNPIFGITSHPGFGDEEGQYPMYQYDKLEELYDEVNNVLADIEQGLKSTSMGFAYIAKIENAVKECINSANSPILMVTSPFDYLLDPDPNDPSQPYLLRTNEEKDAAFDNPHFFDNRFPEALNGQGALTLRYQTPILEFDKEFEAITIGITHTHKDLMPAENDGPYYLLYELSILDADGNRVEIPAANISSNVPAGDGNIANIYDNDIYTYFASISGGGVVNRGNHAITIVLPEPMSKIQLIFEDIYQKFAIHSCPNGIRITTFSPSDNMLRDAIERSKNVNSTWGLEPCYFEADLFEYNKALEEAKAVLADPNSTNDQKLKAANALNDAIDQLSALNMNPPIETQEYFITSRQAFMEQQGIQKNLTVFQDSILWWDSANPSDPNQRWIFTPVKADDPSDTTPYYTIKNVGTGKYVGDFLNGDAFEPTGEPIAWGSPYIKLGNEPAKFSLSPLGQGQTLIQSYSLKIAQWCTMACMESNSGVASERQGSSGGSAITNNIGYSIHGVRSAITSYNAGKPNTTSAFSIVPAMNDLPYTIEAADVSDKKLWHFSTGGKMLTFTADKNCAFANFKLYDKTHAEVMTEKKAFDNVLIVTVPSNMGDFYFAFDNTEGVQTITIDASLEIEADNYEILRNLYNAELRDYTEGTDVGCIKDLSAYTAAMTRAKELLNGEVSGSIEDFAAAIIAIQEAVAGLETVQPEADKEYVIVSVHSWNGSDLGLFYSTQAQLPGWTYFYAEDMAFHWQFEPSEKEGGWYIKNVASQDYISYKLTGGSLGMSKVPASYEVIGRGDNSVLIHCLEEGADVNRNINATQNGSPYGPLRLYQDDVYSRWYIREVGYYTNVEVIEAEPERPWATGIYDLYGRRVENPTKGIYIVNGKKMLIK